MLARFVVDVQRANGLKFGTGRWLDIDLELLLMLS